MATSGVSSFSKLFRNFRKFFKKFLPILSKIDKSLLHKNGWEFLTLSTSGILHLLSKLQVFFVKYIFTPSKSRNSWLLWKTRIPFPFFQIKGNI